MPTIKEISEHPYPYNLFYALCPQNSDCPPSNLLEALEEQLDTLTEKERNALHLRYRDHMKLSEIGEQLGFTGNTYAGALIAKGIRKLRHPSRLRRIEAGIAAQTDHGAVQESSDLSEP